MKLTIALGLVLTLSQAIGGTNTVQIAPSQSSSAANGYWVSNGVLLNLPDQPNPVGIYGTNHFNSWGVPTTNKPAIWKDPKQRERFNSLMAGKYHMDTNGFITRLTNSPPVK